MSTAARTHVHIGEYAELERGGRIVAEVEGREIVAFALDGELFAYENYCPHLGGPVGEGKLIPHVEAVLDEDGSVIREQFVPGEMRLVCPWHGFEFDVKSGRCTADGRCRLRRWEVVRDDNDAIYVLA
jgi:nitrite reductase (NADH) small subunit